MQTAQIVEHKPWIKTIGVGVIAMSALAGCAGGDGFRPGESEVPRGASPGESAAPRSATVRWEHAAQVPSMLLLQDTTISRGHGTGNLHAKVSGNTAAAASLDTLRPGVAASQGAIFVSQHTLIGSGVPDGLFAMVKREPGYFPSGGDWEWVVVRADGNVLALGRLETCARCHADAAADFVFPRSVPTVP